MTEPLIIPAIKITQPLGTFYVFKMKAEDLMSVSYSSRAKYKKTGYLNNVFAPIAGTQRELSDAREEEIARYIDSVECAIPNSIVLGANISEDGSWVDDDKRWVAEEAKDGSCKLTIPTSSKVASIIDGQHRLGGCMASDRKDLELLCAVYLDLPLPYQAYLFASINVNQKKVPKSLAYELYGFGSDAEDKILWSPEKLSVAIVRKLNFDKNSKIRHKIVLGAQSSEDRNGFLSLAALVDSILSLITTNPKKDRDNILHYRNKKGRSTLEPNEKAPLRKSYIEGDDDLIEKIIFQFIDIIFDRTRYNRDSYLYKTIGIQSLFNLLKKYMLANNNEFDKGKFVEFCEPIWNIDFTDHFYTASGIGKSRISNSLLLATGIIGPEGIRNERDAKKIQSLLL